MPSGPSSREWIGRPESDRGLGLFAFGAWGFERVAAATDVPWVLPVDVHGPSSFRLLGIWTVQHADWPSYERQVEVAVDACRSDLQNGNAILAGDLNGAPQTAIPQGHLDNVARLEGLGMRSAYHAVNSVAHGAEPVGTLYWRHQREKPYHCDFAFVPAEWVVHLRSVTVGAYDDWVATKASDHVPVVVDLDLPPDSQRTGRS